MQNKQDEQIVRIKVLHDTTYKQIQASTNNYIRNIVMMGGKIVGSPQLNIKRLPEHYQQQLQQQVNQYLKSKEQDTSNIKQRVYRKCLAKYSKEHPDLHLDINTPMKALNFYGLNSLIHNIKEAQQEIIQKQSHILNTLRTQSKVSSLQYYMKITYRMPYQIYKDSKQWL